jgi:hypothetical protein
LWSPPRAPRHRRLPPGLHQLPRAARRSTTVLTRRVQPVCVQLERKRRVRRSLPVPRRRCETTRSHQLCFVQGAQRFGGPPARTCTQQMGPQEDVSRGRRGTIARCRLFPEPSHGSRQWPFRRSGIHQRPGTLAFRAVEIESPIGERTGTWIRHFDGAVLAFETLLCLSSSRPEHFKAKGDALPTRRTAFKSKHDAGSPRGKRRAVADLRPTAPVARI